MIIIYIYCYFIWMKIIESQWIENFYEFLSSCNLTRVIIISRSKNHQWYQNIILWHSTFWQNARLYYCSAKVWKQQTIPAFVVTTNRNALWRSKIGKNWSSIYLPIYILNITGGICFRNQYWKNSLIMKPSNTEL